jgi:uncharacterized protein (TIGR02001 family)
MSKHIIRTAAMAGTLAAASFASMNTALAQDAGPWGFSANIGAVSNYLFRGVTLSNDQPAIQGGLDVEHESGFYAGTWASSLAGNDGTAGTPTYELDLYAGYGGAINDDFSYDFNAVYFLYPDGRDFDYSELMASATYKWFTAGIAYTIWGEADSDLPFSDGDLYYFGSVDLALPYDFGLSLFGGYYDFDTKNIGGVDYGHGGISISKDAGDFGTFSFNYEQVGRDTYDDDPKFWVGWSKGF